MLTQESTVIDASMPCYLVRGLHMAHIYVYVCTELANLLLPSRQYSNVLTFDFSNSLIYFWHGLYDMLIGRL